MPNKSPPRGESGTPASMPATTPPSYPQQTHDSTLQLVWEMNKTLSEMKGEMNAKVDRLITDVAALDTRVSKISHRIAWVAGGAALAGALIGGVLLFLNGAVAVQKIVSPQTPPASSPAVAADTHTTQTQQGAH